VEDSKMGSLGHLRYELAVAEAHAARRPESQVAARRLGAARAALADRRAALAGRYLTAAGERDAARDEWARRVDPAGPCPELATLALSRHLTAAAVARVVSARLNQLDQLCA
jgi:hypothetical protein